MSAWFPPLSMKELLDKCDDTVMSASAKAELMALLEPSRRHELSQRGPRIPGVEATLLTLLERTRTLAVAIDTALKGNVKHRAAAWSTTEVDGSSDDPDLAHAVRNIATQHGDNSELEWDGLLMDMMRRMLDRP